MTEWHTPEAPLESGGVSVIVPVHNGARTLKPVLLALRRLKSSFPEVPVEFLLVDDHSTDTSPQLLSEFEDTVKCTRIISASEGTLNAHGAAAAMNRAIEEARFDLIAQFDQDVVPAADWLEKMIQAFAAVTGQRPLAALQANFRVDQRAPLLARVNDLDLDLRYQRRGGKSPECLAEGVTAAEQVCTGNTLYWRPALVAVGLFDESLGYGYDNDLSYRLAAAGWSLGFAPGVSSQHLDREHLGPWVRRQYGLGYGRLDLIARHPYKGGGDDVSGLGMILHAVGGTVLLMSMALAAGALLAGWGTLARLAIAVATAVLGLLSLERLLASLASLRSHRDLAALWFAPLHLLRDLSWGAATLTWMARRVLRRPPRSTDSMPQRPGNASEPRTLAEGPAP